MAIADSAKAVASPPLPPAAPARDQELQDWNGYYQMLLAGKLSRYAGRFVVVHKEAVIAHGTDPEQLRCDTAKQLGIAGANLVIPFVDDKECLTAE